MSTRQRTGEYVAGTGIPDQFSLTYSLYQFPALNRFIRLFVLHFVPIHEPTGAWAIQHTHTTTSKSVCVCARVFVLLLQPADSTVFSFSCNLIVHFPSCSRAQRFNLIVKIAHKGFHIGHFVRQYIALTFFVSNNSLPSFELTAKMWREFALIYIILIFIIFFVLTQTILGQISPISRSLSLSLPHKQWLIHCFIHTVWLLGCLFEPLLSTLIPIFAVFSSLFLFGLLLLWRPRNLMNFHIQQNWESARGTKRSQSVDEMKTRLVPVCFMVCIYYFRVSLTVEVTIKIVFFSLFFLSLKKRNRFSFLRFFFHSHSLAHSHFLLTFRIWIFILFSFLFRWVCIRVWSTFFSTGFFNFLVSRAHTHKHTFEVWCCCCKIECNRNAERNSNISFWQNEEKRIEICARWFAWGVYSQSHLLGNFFGMNHKSIC